MNKTKILLTLLFTIFCASPKLYAQLDSLSNGDCIRLTGTKYFLQPTVATFSRIHSDTLFCYINNKVFAVPVNHLQKLEIPIGKRRHTIKGMIIGSISGGLILGIAMHSEEQQAEGFGKVGQPGFWGGFASGALIGGGLGALIGSQIKSDKWKQINIGEK